VTSCNEVVIEGMYLRVCSLFFVSVEISDTHTYCLYTHKGDGSF